MTEEHDMTIRVQWTEHNYGSDGCDATATLIFFPPQFPNGLEVHYTGDYFEGDILPRLLRDFTAYVSNPVSWVREYLRTGSDTWEKLRLFQSDAEAAQDSIQSHQYYKELAEVNLAKLTEQISAIQAALEKEKGDANEQAPEAGS